MMQANVVADLKAQTEKALQLSTRFCEYRQEARIQDLNLEIAATRASSTSGLSEIVAFGEKDFFGPTFDHADKLHEYVQSCIPLFQRDFDVSDFEEIFTAAGKVFAQVSKLTSNGYIFLATLKIVAAGLPDSNNVTSDIQSIENIYNNLLALENEFQRTVEQAAKALKSAEKVS